MACNWFSSRLPPVILGIVIKCFGDSFDGSLVHYRNPERSRFGFLVDRARDLFSRIVVKSALRILALKGRLLPNPDFVRAACLYPRAQRAAQRNLATLGIMTHSCKLSSDGRRAY